MIKRRREQLQKTKLIKRALIPGEGSCLKDGKKSGKSIIRTTYAAKAANDGLGPKPMDKSHLLSNATPIEDVNYQKYLMIMTFMKQCSPFVDLFKEERMKLDTVIINVTRQHAINSGEYDTQPMSGGCVVLGGGTS